MHSLPQGSATRCLLTWLAATAAAAVVIAWLAPTVASGPRAAPFDAVLTWSCAVVAALCTVWGWVLASVVVLEAVPRCRRPRASAGVPGWLRRLVLAACGAAVIGVTSPAAGASGSPETDGGAPASVLHGLPLPDRPLGRSVPRQVEPGPPVDRLRGLGTRHVVRSGESLWSIAEAVLQTRGRPPTHGEVARHWPRIHALNRSVIGPDPHLLRPGLTLRLSDRTDLTDLTDSPTSREDLP